MQRGRAVGATVASVVLVTGCGLVALGGAPSDTPGAEAGTDGTASSSSGADAIAEGAADGNEGDEGGIIFLGDAGGRVTRGLVALYPLRETAGNVVHDSEGTVRLNLTRVGTAGPDMQWDADGLTFFGNGTEVASTLLTPTKITPACKASNEVTAEAWISPTTAEQAGPARILSLSNGTGNQSFMLGIGDDGASGTARSRIIFRVDRSGGQRTIFESADGIVTTQRQHVVATAKTGSGVKVYIDTVPIANERDSDIDTTFAGWINSNSLRFGSELGTNDRRFRGTISLVAIYCVELTPAEIATNFAAGARP